jgi:hypothetical protein
VLAFHSSDLSLAIREMNVDVMATANTAQPTAKMTTSLLAMTGAPQHKVTEAQD